MRVDLTEQEIDLICDYLWQTNQIIINTRADDMLKSKLMIKLVKVKLSILKKKYKLKNRGV